MKTVVITGGSKCGKSRLAEEICGRYTGEKIYLATMRPYGTEAHEAISRHRAMRKNKGFLTREQYTDIEQVELPGRCAVLLECMGNLLANEMFSGEKPVGCTGKILSGIRSLQERTELLAIVTNQVGADGMEYTPETRAYIAALGEINRKIAETADLVIECVYGIPVVLRGEYPC